MNKGFISALLALVILITVYAMFIMRWPDLSLYQHLKDPAIRTMPSQRVLVVEAKGIPGTIGKKAFGFLFKTYFGIKGIPKGKNMPAPRARWPQPATVAQSEWIGRYAMPVPDTMKDVPLPKARDGLALRLTTWEYGEVAEILHLGPYDKEEPTIRRLYEFIAKSGYEIAGDHEEEYVKGPGMFFKGKPDRYVTIIRYQVRKREVDSATLFTERAVH